MENYSIKSVTFGGFDKQDVVRYIEQASQEAAEAQKQLQEENDGLREQVSALTEELAALRLQAEELTALRGQMQADLTRETAAHQSLEPLKAEAEALRAETEQLKAELEALRPDAQSYAQFRERIGAIECEARERAAALEAETAVQLKQTVDLFRAQYQGLMSTFEATAAHVNGELRKVEVNLSQLPRAMDQAGAELNELASLLDK